MLNLLRGKSKTNPAFYERELRLVLGGEPERLDLALTDPASVDLLTWDVFASLDSHQDREYLAYRLQGLGGAGLRAPVRLSLWVGHNRQPHLRPSPHYLSHIRERARRAGGDDASVADFGLPVEVPVIVETPDVLVLVDTMVDRFPLGVGGRDRIVELVDVGVDQARRLSKTLAVAFVYKSGSEGAAELSGRIAELRDPARLAEKMPYRSDLPPIVLREMSWQKLLGIWKQEAPYLQLAGEPTRRFTRHVAALGLR